MKKKIGISLGLVLLAGCSEFNGVSNFDQAETKLNELVETTIQPSRIENQYRANIKLTTTNLLELLPDINEYKMTVTAQDSSQVESVEIFTSSEKAGNGVDGIYVDLARKFNSQGFRLPNGKTGKVAIRRIASGAAASFLLAEQSMPDGYSPSNALWGQMLQSQGVELSEIADKTAPNTAGVVVQSSKIDEITTNGKLDIQKLLTAVTSGQFAMGYTNPYQSSTGLNFLLTVLHAFAQGDERQMLAPDVASAFEAFQRGIPFVAQNTLQMREATVGSGVLDAFVMEYQTFINSNGLGGYEFVPFGVRHDSPIYATAEADEDERQVLQAFADFVKRNAHVAKEYGFNKSTDYKAAYNLYDGSVISSAQRLWKDKKSGGRPIAAVFVADVSGSMDGDRMRALKAALDESANFVSSRNSIGLVTFNEKVNVDLPIRKFDLQQKSQFLGSVERMSAGGGTATNDAILVAADELLNFSKTHPEHKLTVFVLSDGETRNGLLLDDIDEVVQMLNIPVHSIAYGFESSDLKTISGLVEASYTESSTGSAAYQIGNLLNAQM
ncbi:vWA domain-containing protein [Parendozoicomonas sp. Alg238-R29]|uniref:vWA domain-containing protein n=1 Tax=Parendozoicomonas sp. Alg238-R29 TaxID=2993446 RepID=UPI00248E04AE|nr:vWA domain-containing protein [Parendozoicomonas sp. Alg238-R29]